MRAMTVVLGLALQGVGIWTWRVERDHVLRRPALLVLALLSVGLVGLLIWDAPTAATPLPVPSPMPTLTENPAEGIRRPQVFWLLCMGLMMAGPLTLWPKRLRGIAALLCGLCLSVLVCLSVLACLGLAFSMWWGSQGGAQLPFVTEFWLGVLLLVVSAAGLVRHGGGWFLA